MNIEQLCKNVEELLDSNMRPSPQIVRILIAKIRAAEKMAEEVEERFTFTDPLRAHATNYRKAGE